jgi:diguanylate cyclase
MQYPESVIKSAEYLRQALPLMTRQRAALHPLSYAVWYEHVSGCNTALSRDIHVLTERGQTLDDAQTRTLYSRHIGDARSIDDASARRIGDALATLLRDMAGSADEAGAASERFGAVLDSCARELAERGAGLPLRELLMGTQEMREQMHKLRRRLDSSQQEINQLREQVAQARGEALVDALTGLANRRAFDRELRQCLQQEDAGTPTSPCLIFGDIDHFKRINDSHGHAAGDEVLRIVAQTLRSVAHSHHLAARIGGEEFAILMPGAGLHEAVMLAEALRERVAAQDLPPMVRQSERVTISLGVTQLAVSDAVPEFLGRADQALYSAKHGGRNRVVVLPPPQRRAA